MRTATLGLIALLLLAALPAAHTKAEEETIGVELCQRFLSASHRNGIPPINIRDSCSDDDATRSRQEQAG